MTQDREFNYTLTTPPRWQPQGREKSSSTSFH
jgi:hypothetical protein